MTRYRLDANARNDLDAIYDYIAFHNTAAADRLIDRFHEVFSLLASQPFLGERASRLGAKPAHFS